MRFTPVINRHPDLISHAACVNIARQQQQQCFHKDSVCQERMDDDPHLTLDITFSHAQTELKSSDKRGVCARCFDINEI